jgi:hypothetical protein
VKLGQYLGYGAGDAANNLTFSMVSAFLLLISLSHPIRPSGITMQALCVKPRCGYPGRGSLRCCTGLDLYGGNRLP